MSNCLCGHFEWCEFCSRKPDAPEVLRKMTAADWGRSFTVTLEPDPVLEKIQKVFKKARRP